MTGHYGSFASFSDRHWTALVAKIDQEYADRTKQLAAGFAKSHDEYRERVGYLTALRDIAAWSEEIARSMDARPKKET